MPKRTHLRAVNSNDMPEQTSNQAGGVSLRTVVIVTLVTTVASQLVIDAYRAVKGKIKESREAAANPQPEFPQMPTRGMLPAAAMPRQQIPMQAPHTPQVAAAGWSSPWSDAEEPQETPSPSPAPVAPQRMPAPPAAELTASDLREWQRALERKQANLEQWERDLNHEQRHLRLVGSS